MKLDFYEVFDDCTSRCKKIPKEEYLAEGKNIVIDQGQNIIAGYTNVEDGLFEDIPAIVFGDHTRIIKYVDKPFFLGADGVKLLKSKINGANYKYLYYVLSNAKIPDTGYNRHFKWLKEISLEYKDVESQKKIVRTLDSVTKIIELCKIELSKLDNLIKARFVEMFGDPKINSQNRPEIELINVVTMQRGFDLPVNERKENGEIPVYGSNGILGYHNIAKVHGGGIITGRSGTIGKVQYIKGDYWPLNTTLFSTKTHNNNIVFLAYLIELFDLSRFVEGTGVPTLNRNKFHNKKIINIPKREQKQFADFVQQVSKSKIVLQRLRSFTMIMTWE